MQPTQVHPQMYPQQQVPPPQPQMQEQQQQWQQQPQQQQQWQQQAEQPQQQQQWQQQPQLQQQPQMMYAAQQPALTERPGFNKKAVNILGILQIVFGVICIILQAVAFGTQCGFFFVCHGIWCSVFYITAGSLSIGASKTLNSCMIVSSMVLSIIAAIFAGIHLCLSAGGIPFIQNSQEYCNSIRDAPAIFLEVLALLISLAEIIAAIVTSVYACKTTCCSTPAQNGQTFQPMQYVTLPGGQTVPVVILGPNTTPGQPIMMNPGMVMAQQQPAPSTAVQAEAPPAYEALAASTPQETKEQL